MRNLEMYYDMEPFVRMLRIKKAAFMTGKWRDIDNVFTYIASGSGDFIIDGMRYSLGAGDAIIIPAYKTHVIISQGEEPLVQYIMHFDFYEEKDRLLLEHKDILEEEGPPVKMSDRERMLCQEVLIAQIHEADRNDIMRRYLSMVREFQENKPGKRSILQADCKGILLTMLRNCMELEASNGYSKGNKTKSWIHIENAIGYITNHLQNTTMNNEDIAAQAGVTPNYLTRVFQEYLGMSLHRYILNLRIEKAQQLLLAGKANITEISLLTGFSSIYVFSKAFKSTLGVSPTEFMAQTVNKENMETRGKMYVD